MRSGAAGVVAVAGEALVDLVPAPVGEYFEIAPGGSPANVALGLARLESPARLLARIADDLLSRRIRAHLTHNGVQLDHAVAGKEQTSLAMVSLDENGSPAYDFRINGTADWQWTPAEIAGALDPWPAGPVAALHSGSLARPCRRATLSCATCSCAPPTRSRSATTPTAGRC